MVEGNAKEEIEVKDKTEKSCDNSDLDEMPRVVFIVNEKSCEILVVNEWSIEIEVTNEMVGEILLVNKISDVNIVVNERSVDISEEYSGASPEVDKICVIVVGAGGVIDGVAVPLLPWAFLFSRTVTGRSVYTYQAITPNPNSSVKRPVSTLWESTFVKSCMPSK